MLKTLEKNPFEQVDSGLYKAYLLTIIENNERSLSKACSLFIENKENLTFNEKDVALIIQMIKKHIRDEHDLEVLWLLYLLIETNNVHIDDPIVQKIVDSKNELAQIILLRRSLLTIEKVDQLCNNAFSWILIYELYSSHYIPEQVFVSKLNLNRNLHMYQYLKQNNIHFCER